MKRKFIIYFIALILLVATAVSCDGETSDTEHGTETAGDMTDTTSGGTDTDAPVIVEDTSKLIITEVMAGNNTVPVEGFRDFIELYNGGVGEAELKNYSLTDGSDVMILQDIVLYPGEYAVVTIDGTKTDLRLRENGGALAVVNSKGERVCEISYPQAETGMSYLPTEEEFAEPTPGYENTDTGRAEYVKTATGDLIISEIITSNTKYYPVNGEYYDLIELRNMSDHSVILSDYYISDKKSSPLKYNLPDVLLAPGDVFVIPATDDFETGASFKLSSDGEYVYLSTAERAVDAFDTYGLPRDVSVGRGDDGERRYYFSPSFGEVNSGGVTELAEAPASSVESGFYDSAVSVSLSANGDIYYTLDGSRPTEKSKKYSSPIEITETTPLRTLCVLGESRTEASYQYFIGEEHALPVVMVSIDPDDFYGDDGIYTNYKKDWEREINLSYFVDGKREFSVGCGIKIFGATGRKEPKKSFQLKFRSEYGTKKLCYSLFDGIDIDEFNSLVLRSGSQDWCAANMRDELATSLAGESGTMLTQAYRPVAMFVNGEYYGIYYFRERIDDDFVADHIGVSPESVAIIQYGSSLDHGTRADRNDWDDMCDYIESHDMKKKENYDYVKTLIDVESLADWFIFRAYAGDLDSDNIRYYRTSEGSDNRWKLIFYDLDLSFRSREVTLGKILREANYTNIPMFYLMKNAEFKEMFLERFGYHAKNTLSDGHVNDRIEEISGMIEGEIAQNHARWEKDVIACQYAATFDFARWEKDVGKLYSHVNKDGASRLETAAADIASVLGMTKAEVMEYLR